MKPIRMFLSTESMRSIRLFLRMCVDSANADGIISKRVVRKVYNKIGDNLFNLNLKDALYVSVVRIMASCENDIHVSDVYAMWNACREFVGNGYVTVPMAQLQVSYMMNPREFAKCIRNEQDYKDIVENKDDFKLSICLFEIMKIIYMLASYISIHSNVDPATIVCEQRELSYGLYDE